MRLINLLIAAFALMTLAACSTTQEVSLTKQTGVKSIGSVAQIAESSNSKDMDMNLESVVIKQGLALKPKVTEGTRTAAGVDALVSYTDVWRWDLVMYLKSLKMRLYDAQTGDLVVMGEWSDSTFHGFRDSRAVMENLLAEMLAKVNAAKSP